MPETVLTFFLEHQLHCSLGDVVAIKKRDCCETVALGSAIAGTNLDVGSLLALGYIYAYI